MHSDAGLSINEILEQIPEAFFALNREWEFTYANELACQILRRDREALMHKKVWSEFAEALGLRFEHQYRKAMEQRVPVQFEEYFEPLKTWFRVRAYPSPCGIYVYFNDISDQKRISETLQHAVRLAKLGHWDWDLKEDRVFCSEYMQEILGLPTEQTVLSYAEFIGFVHPDDRCLLDESVQHVLSTGNVFEQTFRIERAGEICFVHSHGNTFFDDHENPVRMVGTIQDITAQKRSEESLRESKTLLQISEKLAVVGQLAAGVAHEIRNPLTAIKGFIQLMQKEAQASKQRYLDVMQMEVDRMQSIVGELLLLAKPQSSDYLIGNIKPILDDVVSVMGTQAIMTNVEIEIGLESDELEVMCEPNHLKQVFINIIKNAIEAMPNGGRISINAYHKSDIVQIEVTDEGEGIAADQVNRLGEPFFTTKETGTGLGLLVTQRIIGDHSGTLTFDSKVGQGTTVKISLPRYYSPYEHSSVSNQSGIMATNAVTVEMSS